MEYGEACYSEVGLTESPEGLLIGAKTGFLTVEATRTVEQFTIEATRTAKIRVEPGG